MNPNRVIGGPIALRIRFVCFLRESKQKSLEGYGLKAQLRDCQKFAETWPGAPHDISEQYCPTVVESATKWDRQTWERAIDQGIDLVRAGLRDAFLFPRVDRETRNLFASIPILRRAIDAGVPIYFAQEKLHLHPKVPDAIDRYIDEAREAVAYVRRLAKLTAPGRIARARDDGKLPTNKPLFGFDIVDGHRVVNQAQAAALRGARETILRDGPGAAARWLNGEGWRTNAGKPFTSTTLAARRGIFRNRALVGESFFRFKDETVVIGHEAIFSEDEFEQVNAVLDGRRLRQPRSTTFYALRGLVFSGDGQPYESHCGKGQHRYYRLKGGGARYRPKDELEFEVANAFIRYLEDKERRVAWLEIAQKSEAELRMRLANVERASERNMAEWTALLKKDLSGYPPEVVEGAKLGLDAQRRALEAERRRLKSDLARIPQLDPSEVERAVMALAQPWVLVCGDGRIEAGTQHVMSWECMWRPGMPRRLSQEQARILRDTMMRLNARITIINYAIRITGQMAVRAKAACSRAS